MATSEVPVVKFGGFMFIIAGVLFLATNVLIIILPYPPPVEFVFNLIVSLSFSAWLVFTGTAILQKVQPGFTRHMVQDVP